MMHVPKYFVVAVIFLGLLVVSAQTSNAQTPAQQLNVPEGSGASLNWSGYVAGGNNTSDQYTSVTGTWVIPTVPASAGKSADATWVGIGGVSSRDLIQAGTQAIVQDGAVTYSAWIETLPGFSQTVSLPVKSGDSVTATVTEVSPGEWLVTISNNTTGTSYSRTVEYDSSKSSAEWVEEMVTNGDGTFRPLDSFSSVNITNAAATVNGASQNLSQLDVQPLQMMDRSGQILAAVSSITNDNAGFSVTRSDALVTTPATVTIVRHRPHVHSQNWYTAGGTTFTFTIVGL